MMLPSKYVSIESVKKNECAELNTSLPSSAYCEENKRYSEFKCLSKKAELKNEERQRRKKADANASIKNTCFSLARSFSRKLLKQKAARIVQKVTINTILESKLELSFKAKAARIKNKIQISEKINPEVTAFISYTTYWLQRVCLLQCDRSEASARPNNFVLLRGFAISTARKR